MSCLSFSEHDWFALGYGDYFASPDHSLMDSPHLGDPGWRAGWLAAESAHLIEIQRNDDKEETP